MKKWPTKKQAKWIKEQQRVIKNLVDAFEAYTKFHKRGQDDKRRNQ